MPWVVPVELETAVYAATRTAVGEAALATGALTRAIVDRSQRYTSDRGKLSQPADRTGDLAARAAFFTKSFGSRSPAVEKANVTPALCSNPGTLGARARLRSAETGSSASGGNIRERTGKFRL